MRVISVVVCTIRVLGFPARFISGLLTWRGRFFAKSATERRLLADDPGASGRPDEERRASGGPIPQLLPKVTSELSGGAVTAGPAACSPIPWEGTPRLVKARSFLRRDLVISLGTVAALTAVIVVVFFLAATPSTASSHAARPATLSSAVASRATATQVEPAHSLSRGAHAISRELASQSGQSHASVDWHELLIVSLLLLFGLTQLLYSVALGTDLFFHTRRVDWVTSDEVENYSPARYPMVVLLYPVLRELEETMRTTFLGLAKLDYPSDRFRIVAIPNETDRETVESLQRLQAEFSFLEVLLVPPTSDLSWGPVWDEWADNAKAYWWHHGATAQNRDLPPKKTRQLVYALYILAQQLTDEPDWLLDYIDADSVPPVDHFLAGAAGSERFDVVQSTNVAGNLLDSWAASWHAMDHMIWDGLEVPASQFWRETTVLGAWKGRVLQGL